ncbi:MAG: histidine kinase dimerization/phospho-acceptor domain-containing protein [Candidatus Sulfotelmatobacter sp.]
MSKRSKIWLAAATGMTAVFMLAALTLPRSFGLTAFSDLTQCLLLLSGAVAFIPLVRASQGRMRLFWSLITLGIGLWLAYQIFWTYYEVVLQQDVPDLCAWDIVLFLHMVPLMAAIGLRPHVPRDEYAARVGRMDFTLLVVWWIYLYVLLVMPWQYVVPDIAAYDRNLNLAYNAEKIAYLTGLVACWMLSKGEWKKLYAFLFGIGLCYSTSSTIANWAIARRAYYSGSLYDIPLVAAMGCLTWVGLRTKLAKPEADAPGAASSYGVWIARCSMIAVFSLPLLAGWVILDGQVPARIRVFRLTLTLCAAFFMGVLVFVRQQMLDRELYRLLSYSHDSFDSLKRLQAQILQSEKLASIGQLVGGAAHELNNPITAMLGYSDLLLSTALTAEQKPLAAKIGQHVRRTKSLVASLISFARQSPSPKTPLDLNTLARTAVKLTQPQWEALEIDVRMQLDSSLQKVLGDSNQLLQVCLQMLANSLHLLAEHGGRVVNVTTEGREGVCLLQIFTPGAPSSDRSNAPPAEAEDGLALSACQGILQEHQGQILREYSQDGAMLLRVELPAIDPLTSTAAESKAPARWQSQPFA